MLGESWFSTVRWVWRTPPSRWRFTLPNSLHWIARDNPVTSYHDKTFFECLSNKQPVKGIAVYVGKSLYPFEMNDINSHAPKTRHLALPVKVY